MGVGRRFWWVGGGRRFFECVDVFERSCEVEFGSRHHLEVDLEYAASSFNMRKTASLRVRDDDRAHIRLQRLL